MLWRPSPLPDLFRAVFESVRRRGPPQIGHTRSRFARARQMAIRSAIRRQFKAIRTTFRQFGAFWRKCGRTPCGFSGPFRQFGTRDLRYYNTREGHAMSRGGASRRHGHGATAAGSAGAPGSRILARPVVSVVVGGRRPGFDAVGRYHALFSASSLAADALASARSGSGMPLVPLRSVQAKACFGARPAFDVVGLLHGACARTEVHQVSLEIWTSNSHQSVIILI